MRMIHDTLADTHVIVISSKLLDDPRHYAEVARPKGLMILNPRQYGSLDDFISSFVHECLHVHLNTSDDRVVYALERRVYDDCSSCEKQNLLAYLAEHASWDD